LTFYKNCNKSTICASINNIIANLNVYYITIYKYR